MESLLCSQVKGCQLSKGWVLNFDTSHNMVWERMANARFYKMELTKEVLR